MRKLPPFALPNLDWHGAVHASPDGSRRHALVLERCLLSSALVIGPGPSNEMEFIEILGIVAGLCTSGALIPQVVTTIKKKKASDVSVFMFVVMLTGNGLWTYYGVDKSDAAIIGTNLLSFSLNVIMLVLKFRYRDNE